MLACDALGPSSTQPILNWLERDSCARMIVDDDLLVHWINAAADEILRHTGAIRITNDKLRISKRELCDPFLQFVRGSGDGIAPFCLHVSFGEHLLLTAQRVRGTSAQHLTGLTLRRTTRRYLLYGDALETAFRLTSTERKVLESLFLGETADEVGDRLHMSVGTVRTHIRHIYNKVDVNSREAMFSKLLPYISYP
jgi:DNA-binding CsgD family transcriptional regulator